MSRHLTPWLGLLLLAGCTSPAATVAEPVPPAELGAAFDPAATGTIRGRVLWHGPGPLSPLPQTGVVPDGDAYRLREVGNPFALVVDPVTKGIAGALVTLDGIDPTRSRPWDHPPVTLTAADFAYKLTPPSGVVRRGEGVTFVSRDPELHVVRARGAAFFSLTFPTPNQPRTRRLDTPGAVELTSGAGYFWDAVDLCVRVDPYATVTDTQGRFELPRVPDGSYTLTMRLRDPKVVRVERDPETGLPFRHVYAVPVVRGVSVTVVRGAMTAQDFSEDAWRFGAN